jgi:hypothetical protein
VPTCPAAELPRPLQHGKVGSSREAGAREPRADGTGRVYLHAVRHPSVLIA